MIISIEIMEAFQSHTDWHTHQLQEIGFNYHHLSLHTCVSFLATLIFGVVLNR